ncbi:hypothetical protein CEB3_c18430 [Peptococcaceae bacterium CEB3]|nr:hypothetical protein CEB3_c18430 [Peptococcaceae bacterium CEB3]
MLTRPSQVLTLRVMNSLITGVDSSGVFIPAATTRPFRPEMKENRVDRLKEPAASAYDGLWYLLQTRRDESR